jgi:hypothetical protein
VSTNRGLGCPFVAGPACRDCNGDCWDADEAQDAGRVIQGVHVPHCNVKCIGRSHWLIETHEWDAHAHDKGQQAVCDACRARKEPQEEDVSDDHQK